MSYEPQAADKKSVGSRRPSASARASRPRGAPPNQLTLFVSPCHKNGLEFLARKLVPPSSEGAGGLFRGRRPHQTLEGQGYER
jgi:hypothetical protein